MGEKYIIIFLEYMHIIIYYFESYSIFEASSLSYLVTSSFNNINHLVWSIILQH